MAWYEGTYSCGHDGRVQIYGPGKDREWKREYEFRKMCSECYDKHLIEKRDEENQKAYEASQEMELPELRGTPKQIAWANTLRLKIIEVIDHTICKIEKTGREAVIGDRRCSIDDMYCIKEFIVSNRLSASYYINIRHEALSMVLSQEADEALKSEEELKQDKIEEEIRAESVVYPEQCSSKEPVEIVVMPKLVVARFGYNPDLIDVVKSLEYRFNPDTKDWFKKIKETTGTAEERAAELGNKLLQTGFPILILDPEIRGNAIGGNFSPECFRWIYRRVNTDKLAIQWQGDTNFYSDARSLPGARWDGSSMLVKVNYYEEIEDFAQCFGFRFTKKAQHQIELHKEQMQKAEVVAPAKVETRDEDGLKKILESEADIIDDLKD